MASLPKIDVHPRLCCVFFGRPSKTTLEFRSIDVLSKNNERSRAFGLLANIDEIWIDAGSNPDPCGEA
jgi:hypothetical protein